MTGPDPLADCDQVAFDLAAVKELATLPADELDAIARRDPEAWDALGFKLGEMVDAAHALATNVRLACERWYAARPARGDLQ